MASDMDFSPTCDPCHSGSCRNLPSMNTFPAQFSGPTFLTPITLLTGTPILNFPNPSHLWMQKLGPETPP